MNRSKNINAKPADLVKQPKPPLRSFPKVVVVLLAFNGMKWYENCLGSLLKTEYPNYEVIVVNNGSKDESTKYIKENYPDCIVYEKQKNVGSSAFNIGIKHALDNAAEYVVLLNQDTKVDPGWLTELVRVADDNPRIGVLASLQYNYEGTAVDKDVRNCLGRALDNPRELIECEFMICAAFLLTRQMLMKVGGFDPFYFLYYDEIDLFRRAQYHGFRLGVARDSKICHWEAATRKKMKGKLAYLYMRNSLLFSLKNPRSSLIKGGLDYFKNALGTTREHHGYFRGILSFCKLVLWQAPTLLLIPLILYKRYREKRYACYL